MVELKLSGISIIGKNLMHWQNSKLGTAFLVSLDRTLDWITQIARVGLVLIRNSGLSISDGSQSEPSNKTADCYG